jgi:hypothetical protein
MTESDARSVLLVRAFETTPTPAWSDSDATWASRAARRAEGEQATPERFVARRAALAAARLARRDAGVVSALAAAQPRAWPGWLVVLASLALGAASDAIGPAGRINILAPPLLALLAWNFAVYAIVALRAAGAGLSLTSGSVASRECAPSPWRRLLRHADSYRGAWTQRAAPEIAPAIARFLHDWATASRSLYGARIAVVLHAAAAALVAGALVSLYLRGIAFEYRAGWDSTFLSAADVHRLLAFVLGPAAWLSGIELPTVDELARLRFSLGTGENAAHWIHLYAVTLCAAVVVPRALLAAAATRHAHGIARRFPLSLDDDYFVRLQRAISDRPVAVVVLPYSYRLPRSVADALDGALARIVGPNVAVKVAEPAPAGAEDDAGARIAAAPHAAHRIVAALFALTATPERETHGAFVRALAAHRPAGGLLVLVDESGFRARFTGADGARRLAERRSAWQRMLADEGVDPVFVDLGATAGAAAPSTTPAANPATHS